MERLRASLETRQVWIYFFAMAFAIVPGLLLPGPGSLEAAISPALALMLFATFMQVPLAEMGAAFRHGRFIVALAVTNFLFLPVVVACLIRFLPPDPMLRLAVLLVLLAPCIDYVITFTHLGGGKARLLLAMTPALLALQMLLLPLYLSVLLGDTAAGLLESGPFIHAFVWLIALPLLAAGLMQALAKRSRQAARLLPALDLLPVPATALVLFIVLASVIPQIGLAQNAALRALPVYVGFAVIAPLAGWAVARIMRLEESEARAVSFSASYRNSLVILPFAFAVPGGTPLIPAVILTQTITELFFLPVYLRLIPHLSRVSVPKD